MLRRSLLIGLLLAAMASPALAEDEWVKVTSANFEIYTAAGEKRGRNVVEHFEAIRQFFLDVTGGKELSTLPVRIIGFRSQKQYEPYSPNEVAAAFYTQSRSRDYIVMSNISSEHYDLAVHEYIHLIQRNTGRRVPAWMNEGLAQLYETLTPIGKKVRVGDVQPGRYQLLKTRNWLDLETLFNVDHDSEHYNEKNRAGIFYAQSWALTHMLNLSPVYRESGSYSKLVAAVVSGEPASSAIQRLYGKSLDEIYRDLRSYIRDGRLFAALYDIKLDKAAEEMEAQPAGDLESGLVLADLLSVMRNKEEEAGAKYLELSEKHPESAEVFEGLGYLAFRRRDLSQARDYLGRAVEFGSKTPDVYRDYSYLLQQAGAPAAQRIEILEKALSLQPDHGDTHFQIAFLYLREKNYGQALEHFGSVPAVEEDKVFTLLDGVAYAHYQLERFDEARVALEQARPYAKSPEEKLRVANMLDAIDDRMNPKPAAEAQRRSNPAAAPLPLADESLDKPELLRRSVEDSAEAEVERVSRHARIAGEGWIQVEGVFQTLECLGSTANMHLRSGDETLILAILDPAGVVIRGEKTSLDLRCGPQGDQPIIVEYEKSDSGSNVAGVVRAIQFE